MRVREKKEEMKMGMERVESGSRMWNIQNVRDHSI
jgi:hypothetical protein